MCISNDELNFKCSVSWGWYFNSWFARWAVSHSTGNDTGFQMIWLRRRTRTFSSQLPRGGSENPEGSRYLLKQTLSMEGNWIRAPAESPECRILPPCQQAGCRNIWTNIISGANGVTRTHQPREDSELWGSLDFPTRPRLIYQPTSEADTWDLMRVQLYHTRPHP